MSVWLGSAAAACGGETKTTAAPARETTVTADPRIVEITYLEAERSFGRPRIAELTSHGAPAVRTRAVRALGRVSDDEALDLLDQLIDDGDMSVRTEVVRALGIADATRRAALLAQTFRKAEDEGLREAAIDSIARIGNAAQLAVLVMALREDNPAQRERAAIAMGLYGRRAIAIDDSARQALFAAASDQAVGVRYGVAYALEKEHSPPESKAAERTLKALVKDADAEVRATALAALAARGVRATEVFVGGLDDDDWRVRLASVRALAGDGASLANREFLAAWLAREWAVLTSLEGLAGARIHVVTEGLRLLADHARETAVQASAVGLYDASTKFLEEESLPDKRLGAGHVNCLAAALRVRGGAPLRFLWDCGGGEQSDLPLHVRRALAAEVLGAGFGGEPAERLAKVQELARAEDPRIRAAAVEAAGQVFERGAEDTRAAAEAMLRAGLDDSEVEVAGAAAAAIGALAASSDNTVVSASRGLTALLIARAQNAESTAADLRIAMIEALRGVAAATAACRSAFADPVAGVRESARACLEKATGRDPGRGAASRAPERPPVKPAEILGKQVTWKLETSRGDLEIELDPDRAPWHVAVILRLTDEKRYDGLLWHRVVPGFVSQTGDPRNSGWGGPGFLVPSEPSAQRFERGSVGIADAGKDTGGSQWFVTHARAPHLDGRYTFVGKLTKGQSVLESLVVGDRVIRATIAVTRRLEPQPQP